MSPQQMLAQQLARAPVQQQALPPGQAPEVLAQPAQPVSLDYGEYSDAERQNALGERLMASAGSGPVRTGWEGAGRLGKMLSGALLKGSAARSEKEYTKKRSDYLSNAFNGDNAKVGESLISSGDPKLQELGLSFKISQAQREAALAEKANEPMTPAQKLAHQDQVDARDAAAGRFKDTQAGLDTRAEADRKLRRDIAGQNNASRLEAAKLRTETGLTPQAIDNGAAYFIQTGTMPVGLRNRTDQTAIQNRIAEMKPKEVDAATWMKGLTNAGMAFNARKQAAAQTGKQQALTIVNENTVNGSIKILDDLLKQGAASGLTFTKANDALQWYRRETNDPIAIKLKNTIGTISNEYARVMTGQTGGAASSDAARNESATRMLLGFKDGTMRSVAANLQQEMKARSDSYLNVMNQLTGGEYGGPAVDVPVDIDPAAKPAAGPSLSDIDAELKRRGVAIP